jgi:hypothetical protein
MSDQPLFSRKLLIGWIVGAVAIFALSLYLMGASELTGPDSTGANSYSRSAIGHAGIAELLQRLGIPVVKSTSYSLERLSSGGVLVIAEPQRARQSEESTRRTLLAANTVLLVLPKWTGMPSEQRPGWVRNVRERSPGDAQWVLNLVAQRAAVVRESGEIKWSTNELALAPNLRSPAQLVRGGGLRPIIAGDRGVLVGEILDRGHRIWVLSDPDVIANHGLAREGNAALAVALIKQLRGSGGNVVFDETIHGYTGRAPSPFTLLFRFPFVIATAQGLLAIALLLWATLARFGASQSAPPPLSAGRAGLLQNMAKLIEFAGHQQEMIKRYVQASVRDVARQLHAPRGLADGALIAWLRRVGLARGVSIDCGTLVAQAGELRETGRRDPSSLVRLARDTHRWQKEMLDARSRHPRDH